MKIKFVFRYDPAWPKVRLFRLMRDVGNVGDGKGFSQKIAVALRPSFYRWQREQDGWRLAVLGLEINSRTSFGGRFV